MEDSEKVIVNFVNENNGKRHELEIPLNRNGLFAEGWKRFGT